MKEIQAGFKEIWQEDRGLIFAMAGMMLLGMLLVIFSLVTLNPENSVTKIGYGDIGGYRDGSWQNMLAWPLFALTLALGNNLVAVKLYRKNGGGMARLLVGTTALMLVIGFVVLARLLGES